MKRGYQFLIILIFVLIFLHGCAPQAIPPEVSIQEKAEVMEVPKIEGSTENLQEVPEASSKITEETAIATTEAVEKETVEEKPYRCGKLFDAYTRITGGPQDSGEVQESELISLLAARMQENNVGCAFLVTVDITDFDAPQQIQESIDRNYDLLKPYPNKFTPFLDLDAESSSDFTVERIQQILTEAEGKIDYKGFGEVSFVDPGPWKSKKLTDKPLPEIIDFLGKNNLIFAAHLRNGQTTELETILSEYPKTKVLVHGSPSGMKELLVKHKNLYYAAELEIMLSDGTYGCSISVSDKDVNSAISQYGPIIAAAPDQVLWATNAASKCQFQPQFYSKLMEFTNKFIEKLPEEHREKFAYKNAEGLLAGGA